MSYFYVGRLWEARAVLEGARIIARTFGLPDVELRAIHNLGLGMALDDPREAVALERDGLVLARRLGERATEVVLMGNVTEDCLRTGEWAWAIGELDNAINLDIDAASRRALILVRAKYHALLGQLTDADIAEMERPTEGFEDIDVDVGAYEVRATRAIGEGDWRAALDAYAVVVEQSRLNAPYVLPMIGWLATLAGDPTQARAAVDHLYELGTRGRATEGGRTAILAGIAALGGDRAAAQVGFRQALAQLRELGLPYDEALVTMAAVSCLGADDPETLGWATRAADFLDEVGATPLALTLGRLVEQTSEGAIHAARASLATPSEAPTSG